MPIFIVGVIQTRLPHLVRVNQTLMRLQLESLPTSSANSSVLSANTSILYLGLEHSPSGPTVLAIQILSSPNLKLHDHSP